jgi:hypothetical protein
MKGSIISGFLWIFKETPVMRTFHLKLEIGIFYKREEIVITTDEMF